MPSKCYAKYQVTEYNRIKDKEKEAEMLCKFQSCNTAAISGKCSHGWRIDFNWNVILSKDA